jgi:transcriptional regulator of acetoin/glycerol metabolism
MVALHDDVELFTRHELPPQYRASGSKAPPPMPVARPVSDAGDAGDEDGQSDEELFQKLVRALDDNGGVVLRAADALGITRQKAYRILGKRPGFELETLRKRR